MSKLLGLIISLLFGFNLQAQFYDQALNFGLSYQGPSASLDLGFSFLDTETFGQGDWIDLGFARQSQALQVWARQSFNFETKRYVQALELAYAYENYEQLQGFGGNLRLGGCSDFSGNEGLYLRPGLSFGVLGVLHLHYGYALAFLKKGDFPLGRHHFQVSFSHLLD